MTRLAPTLCALALASCGGGADLPKGWEGARSLPITQPTCSDGTGLGLESTVIATGHAGGIDVLYQRATFRCDQKVQAFLREKDGAFDVLFQPLLMNPSTVARCDCAYNLETSFGAPSGEHKVTVWKRWDAYGQASAPEPIADGSALAKVP